MRFMIGRADAHVSVFEHRGELVASCLHALIGVEDLQRAAMADEAMNTVGAVRIGPV